MAHPIPLDVQLERIKRDAQATANRTGEAVAIYNLNPAGRRLLVIREYAGISARGHVAGPFEPQPSEE